MQVEQHANGDEEQPEEQVAEGTDYRIDLVPVLGFGEHHAGQEGPERKGQAGAVRHPRRGEHDQQYREREQLAQAAVGDDVEQRPQQPAPGGQHRDDGEHAAEHRQQARALAQRVLTGDQRRGEREEGHEGEVLEQQHGKGEAPVGAVELRALRQLLQQDRRRAHRDRTADHDRHEPADAGEMREHAEHARCRDDLGGSEPEHLAAHGEHARQRELKTKGEEQEGHAELGEQAHGARVRHHAERVRSEREADEQVGHAGRQRQAARHRDEQHRACQQDQTLGEGREHQSKLDRARA